MRKKRMNVYKYKQAVFEYNNTYKLSRDRERIIAGLVKKLNEAYNSSIKKLMLSFEKRKQETKDFCEYQHNSLNSGIYRNELRALWDQRN